MRGAGGRRKMSFGGGAGGSESASGSAVGAGAGVGAGEASSKVLRHAGELSVRVRRGAEYWRKDEGRSDINPGSG